MTKSLLKILKALLFMPMLALPTLAMADNDNKSEIEEEKEAITIKFCNGSVQVQNGGGKTILVYDMTGNIVYSQRIDSNSKTFSLNHLHKGLLIVKVGNATCKVTLR